MIFSKSIHLLKGWNGIDRAFNQSIIACFLLLEVVCERLRWVGDGFVTHAMTWRLFCDDFLSHKKVLQVILFGESFPTSSRCMRGFCDPMRTFGDGLKTSSRIDSQNSRELIASQ